MIKVYKKKAIPKDMEIVTVNDVFFNRYTANMLDDAASEIIMKIDNSVMVDPLRIRSRFDDSILNIDKLSTGCKTVLNVMYNRDKVFDIKECGDNALDIIYHLDRGNIYCEYPLISFEMDKVIAVGKTESIISDYDELKEWWQDEM